MLKDQCGYFTLPRSASVYLPDLTGAAVALYWVLFDLAQQHSAVRLEIPAYAIGDRTGLSPNSVHAAGQKLQEKGLVVCTKVEHGLLAYELMNPEKGGLLPAPVKDAKTGKRYAGVYRFKPEPGRSARTVKNTLKPSPPAPAADIPWSEIGGSESQKLRSTMSKIDVCSSKTAILHSPNTLKTNEVNNDLISLKNSEKKGISEKSGSSKDCPGENQTGKQEAGEKKKMDARPEKTSAACSLEREATSFHFGYNALPDPCPTFEAVRAQRQIDWRRAAANDTN